MNQVQTTEREQPADADDEISVLELLITIAKHRRLVISLPAAVAVLSIGVSLALPNVYKATTTLLPPQQAQSTASALLSQLGGMAGAAAGIGGLKNPNDLYIGMLKSRTLEGKLIAKFDLQKVYGTDLRETAFSKLEDNTTITSGKDGLITIEVEDRNQKLVAPLANAYVSELMQLTKVLAVTEAGQRRMFYERQLVQAKDNLAKAEMALKSAIDTRGVVSVDAESRALLETVGRLRAEASVKEIQLSSMRAFVTENNPDYRRAEQELSSLRAELAKLENGRGAKPSDVASADGTQSGIANIKLLRDVKYYQMLYELLAKQYEVARLDEAKDPSIIQVLDTAEEPERKFKPHRLLIVLLSTMFALFGAIGWAFVSEARRKTLMSEAGATRWRELKSHLGVK